SSNESGLTFIKPTRETQREAALCGKVQHERTRRCSNSSGLPLLAKLLDVALLDAAHHLLATEKIVMKLAGQLARNHEKLVVRHCPPRNGASRGNQMRAPLNHQAKIPENKASKDDGSCRNGRFTRTKLVGAILQQNREPHDEEYRERNE